MFACEDRNEVKETTETRRRKGEGGKARRPESERAKREEYIELCRERNRGKCKIRFFSVISVVEILVAPVVTF